VTAPEEAVETVTTEIGGKTEEAKQDAGILRCPSPNRSRNTSPKKRDESPKKTTSLKASASEFVPPGFSSPAKAKSCLQAHAAEFVPPAFNTPSKVTSKLQASTREFVPPIALEPKVAETVSAAEETEAMFIPSSNQTVWTHAVFAPGSSLESSKQQEQPLPKETALPAPMPIKVPVPTLAVNKCEPKIDEEDNTAKWSARTNFGSILDKVKQSLTAMMAPSTSTSTDVDVCLGKVKTEVKKIEEKEADNEVEKQREAAIKQVNEERNARIQAEQREMDETMMDCFLQAVTRYVKDSQLPIMGTTLYGKHMRAARRVGTSCDVKDSSFVWLRPFLESLEDEGLLELKPEVKDPTVRWINRAHPLIRNWKPWPHNETVGYSKAGGRR
jgi:hypothetical protein